MPKINIRNILAPKSEAYALLSELVTALNAELFVEDSSRKILFGQLQAEYSFRLPIHNEEEIIGWVTGDASSTLIASLLHVLVQKEADKKNLGAEVLTLYQEVNLIFNFSEKIAQTIGQTNIAAIALDEAGQLIKSDSGILILWNEESNSIDVLASTGELILNPDKLFSKEELLLHMSQTGQSDIVGDLSALKGAGIILPEVQSLLYATLKVKHRMMGAIMLGSREQISYSAADLKFLITMALQSAAAIESALLYEKNIREAKEREESMRRIYEVTNKFVPHAFIRSLGKEVITDIQLGDQVEKIVTVLFSDIREYTTLAEQMTPDENFRFVCAFNVLMGPIIRAHNGFINQYLGDAIMAIFPNNAADALGAAIDMQAAVRKLNATRALDHHAPIKIGVGMHTGPLIMGITGDHERMDAATIADAVNIASRLESLTKYYKVGILLSENSVNNLNSPEIFHYRHLGLIQLKGKQAPISIYECFNDSDAGDLAKKLNALPYYQQGVSAYFGKSFQEAASTFQQVLEIHPEDFSSRLFLGKSNQYLNMGIPENWTGVEEMQMK